MEHQYPVYTVETECQDCRKCIRHCPVKAIRFGQGRACVDPERCIACGQCVAVCPAQAQRVRDDLGRAKNLLQRKERVYVSLGPGYVSEFAGVEPAKLIAGLKALGFAGVSESALGAQQVSAQVVDRLKKDRPTLSLSSACPAAVGFMHNYLPTQAKGVTPFLSPVLAHCRLLRRAFGEAVGIVFIGPCVAHKLEADRNPELLDIALTFQELQRWLQEVEFEPLRAVSEPQERFIPEPACEGALYAVEGGMNDTLRMYGGVDEVRFMSLAGIRNIERSLSGLRLEQLNSSVFLELLACQGGCVNGPGASVKHPGLLNRLEVLNRVKVSARPLQAAELVDISAVHRQDPIAVPRYEEDQLRGVLQRMGIEQAEDELDCGGCGYETCRGMAQALYEGRAEAAICPRYLRKQTQKKVNALLRCMPSGVVIVDAELKVMECNENFARMFDEETHSIYQARPGLAGAVLEKLIPFAKYFRSVLDTGQDIYRDTLRLGNRIFNIAVFTIEPHRVVGGVVLDVTSSEMPRVQIAQLAQEVIRKNLDMVQEVACRLGENMAETEILLRSLAEGDVTDDGGEQEEVASKPA